MWFFGGGAIGGAFTGGALEVVPKPGGAAGCGSTCSRPGGGRRGNALVVVPGGS